MSPTLLAALLLGASPLLHDAEANYAPVVDYDMTARLNPAAKRVTGTARIKWTNRAPVAVQELWWHLYLNAFRNERSTFIRESGGSLRGDQMKAGEWGWIELTRVRTSTTDLLATRTFEHPDDDNADDRTVMRTPLPAPVEPGETIELHVEWISRLPRVFARSGYAGDFFMVAQWFPKLGVLETTSATTAAWNCHQYHAASEYFADYGRFRVAITTPAGFDVGATGSRLSSTDNPDGTVTVVHEQDRVHDFAWTADRRFVRRARRFVAAEEVAPSEAEEAAAQLGLTPDQVALTDVQVNLLIQPEHLMFEDRYFDATFNALKWFGLWYGAYPYPVLTVVDGPRTARGAMGMEYPTLFTGGARWPTPETYPRPEAVTIHEFGHQYWYGLVGSNEFEEPWLDEGFNTYSTGKVIDRAYGPRMIAPSVSGFVLSPWFGWHMTDQTRFHRVRTLARPDTDAIVRRSWEFRDRTSYGVNSYPRSALTLLQLEKEIGEATLVRVLRTYALRYRYRHPDTQDFIRTAEEVAGRSLRTWFERTVYTPGHVDYAVTKMSSAVIGEAAGVFDAPEGAAPTEHVVVEEADTEDDDDDAPKRYLTRVRVERRGEVPHPVELEIELEDGSTLRRQWDGVYRWRAFEVETATRARHARIHPDGDVLIDLDDVNDSRTREGNALPGVRWGAHVLYIFQTLLQLLGGLL